MAALTIVFVILLLIKRLYYKRKHNEENIHLLRRDASINQTKYDRLSRQDMSPHYEPINNRVDDVIYETPIDCGVRV